MKNVLARFSPLLLTSSLVLLPLYANPELFLGRGNDLEEFFWPIIYFVKQQITQNGVFPLWNSIFMSGMPLVTDPQAPLFYLPNLIFLLFSVDQGLIITITLHTFSAGVAMYVLTNRGLGLSHRASMLSSCLYVAMPKYSAYLEAGHLGLIYSWVWVPLCFYSLRKLFFKPTAGASLLLALSFAMLFYSHTITFLLTAVVCFVITIIFLVVQRKNKLPTAGFLMLSGVFLFGFTAISLLPQLAWTGQTTRQLLLNNPEVYPVWSSKKEFLSLLLIPWAGLSSLNSEKIIMLGILPVFLAFLGFLKLHRLRKLVVFFSAGILVTIALNNASPLYDLLITQKWFILMRVSTRVWYLIVIGVCILAAYAMQNARKKALMLVIGVVAVFELLFISWTYLGRPAPVKSNRVGPQIYQFLAQDREKFRVFCTSGCLSQKQAAIWNLELVEGYNTLQQINYYQFAWQYSGEYWNYYTLAIPPYGIRQMPHLNLDFGALGELNTKYIVSLFEINSDHVSEAFKSEGYIVYLNKLYKPRVYIQNDAGLASLTKITPNEITVSIDTQKPEAKLIISEIYSPGWQAFINDNKTADVDNSPLVLRSIKIDNNTHSVTLKYFPPLYVIGKNITIAMSIICVTYYALSKVIN